MNPVMRHHFLAALFCLVCIGWLLPGNLVAEPDNEAESRLDELEWTLELGRHEKLVSQKQQSGSSLSPFTTDGCSGGLSVGWRQLSEVIDQVKQNHGESPPWESCCITHDLAYYEAGSREITAAMSFEARLNADRQLQACVVETGKQRAGVLSLQYKLTIEDVEQIYRVIADLMYRAVRIGGVPCSGLPWRWGYGWPDC